MCLVEGISAQTSGFTEGFSRSFLRNTVVEKENPRTASTQGKHGITSRKELPSDWNPILFKIAARDSAVLQLESFLLLQPI